MALPAPALAARRFRNRRGTAAAATLAVVAGSLALGVATGAGQALAATGGSTTTFTGSLSATGTNWVTYGISVPADTTLSMKLTWPSAASFSTGLQSPAGTWLKWAPASSQTPQSLTYDAATAGRYKVGIAAKAGASSYTLTVTETPDANIADEGWFDDQESPTHKYTLDQVVAQAKRFSVITALPNTYSASQVTAMKKANPSLQLLAYINGAMAQPAEVNAGLPEAWFLHDKYGKRITNAYHLWLMDPANSGWVNNRVTTCKNDLAKDGYDGCFLDNLGAGTIGTGMVSATPIDPRTHAPYTASDWLAATTKLAGAVRSGTGRVTYSNGLVNGGQYFSSTAPSNVLLKGSDIALAETFIRTSSMGITQYRSETAWKQDVDMLVNAAAAGKRVCTLTKVWVSATQAQKDAYHDYALASFLLGTDGHQCFEFSYSQGSDISAGDTRLLALSALGAPSAAYVDHGGIYQRTFTGGLVLVNPTTKTVGETLPAGSYTNSATGSAVGPTVSMAPHTALILFKH